MVVGAGAFGGWTAFHLLRRGARVTLVDAWGAGHPRGTSSDASRILRCGYGAKPLYTRWAWRSLRLWRRFERAWGVPLFVNSGVLWLCAAHDAYVRASLAALRKHRIPHERLSPRELARRFPQIRAEGIRTAYLEPCAGFLRARLATRTVARAVVALGGRLLAAAAAAPPPSRAAARLDSLRLADGRDLPADFFVFACGPWLPQLFPDLLGARIRVTRQEVFYFGTPPGDPRFDCASLPAWIEVHQDFYGVPAHDARGMKVACDRSGPVFDPTRGERLASAEGLRAARGCLARRFPAMADAPLVDARVCQYERTPDSHLVVDRHPDFANVWLVGGGSGHGFKLGPAVGEIVARCVLHPGGVSIPPELRLGACAWPKGHAVRSTRSF